MTFNRTPSAHTAILLPILVLFISIGCGESGPELGAVAGCVMLDGEPLANAELAFSGVDNGPSAYATTDELGFYELEFNRNNKGTVLGKHEVKIRTERTETVKAEPGQEGDADDEGLVEIYHPEILPARYHSEAIGNPEMTVEVCSGENTIDFPLTSE